MPAAGHWREYTNKGYEKADRLFKRNHGTQYKR